MSSPRVCVLRAPGTNCDHETAHAFQLAGGYPERVHLFELLEKKKSLEGYQILCIPGGFSYGDDIGAGAVFGQHLRQRLKDAVVSLFDRGGLILGICNGFQVLMRSGILPEGPETWNKEAAPVASLTWNLNGKYTATWVHLQVGTTKNVFLRGLSHLELPVAHAEGRIVVAEESLIERWSSNGQLGLCFCRSESERSPREILPYPLNPSGSTANIAGLSDPSGRVFGLMPHPERFVDPHQHPSWTRKVRKEGDGLGIFRNSVEYFRT